jgi:hypothetical protein
VRVLFAATEADLVTTVPIVGGMIFNRFDISWRFSNNVWTIQQHEDHAEKIVLWVFFDRSPATIASAILITVLNCALTGRNRSPQELT